MSALYDRETLRLAAAVADYPMLPLPALMGRARSRICASRLAMTLAMDGTRVAAVGLDLHACAMGQASATLFARHAVGADRDTIEAARAGVAAWLSGEADEVPFGFAAIAAARAYPARHGAIMLPFDAARDALG